MTIRELQDSYAGLGLPAFVDYFELEAEKAMVDMLRVATNPEHVAIDNFTRGRIAALQELSATFKKLKS
jgi:hypothetical protein